MSYNNGESKDYYLVPYMEPKEGCFTGFVRLLTLFHWAVTLEALIGNAWYAGRISLFAAQVQLPDYGQTPYIKARLKAHGIPSWCYIPALKQGRDLVLFIRKSDAEAARRVVGNNNVVMPNFFNYGVSSAIAAGVFDLSIFIALVKIPENPQTATLFIEYQMATIQIIYLIFKNAYQFITYLAA